MMRLGRHMPTNSKPVRAVHIAQQIGCNAIQIFASRAIDFSQMKSSGEARLMRYGA